MLLAPDSGIVVEVKGSHVWVRMAVVHRAWRGPERIHPVDQARDAQYALRHYVESDPRWGSRGRVRWSHHVVLARTDLDDQFALPDLPRWQVSGCGDLAELGQRLFDTTWRWQRDAAAPTRDDVELALRILAGRFPPPRDVVAVAADREDRAQRLTTEQANLLKVTRLRLEIRGCRCGNGAGDAAGARPGLRSAAGEKKGGRRLLLLRAGPTCGGRRWSGSGRGVGVRRHVRGPGPQLGLERVRLPRRLPVLEVELPRRMRARSPKYLMNASSTA